MRIVVNHLTRMRPGYICVAGLAQAGGAHVRPVLERGLPDRLLATKQGPFAIGAIVALPGARPAGRPPETEDHRFNSWKATREGTIAPDAFWTLLTQSSRDRLAAIFGPGLQRHGQTCAVDPGGGRVSLGCLRPAQADLYVDLHDKVRLRLADGEHAVSVAVADLRFYGPDFVSPLPARIAAVAARLAAGVPCILSVGLGRPFLKPGDTTSRHWLQVNNLHLADDPLGAGLAGETVD